MTTQIYLDYNATCPLRPGVKNKMLEVLDMIGNPSSIHSHGRQVRQIIEQGRQTLADGFDVDTKRIIFTSGATESNNWVISRFPGLVITSATEHSSVFFGRRDILTIPVNEEGFLNFEALEKTIKETQGAFLVSIAAANNETGVIQPLQEIMSLVKRYDGFLHCDATQVIGKGEQNPSLKKLNDFDFITLSAHKFGGPSGIGALIVNPLLHLTPLIAGGGQERSFRAGTQNVSGIVGMAHAFNISKDEDLSHLKDWRNDFEKQLRQQFPDCIVVSSNHNQRLSNTSCLIFPGYKGEFLVMRLDLEGISVSSGSACSSGKVKSSHVLKAMGYDDGVSGSSIRISSGWQTQKRDYDALLSALHFLQKKERETNHA